MNIKQIDLRIRDFGDFSDNDLGAKVQLLGLFLVMLIIRPEYQREFRYPVDKQKAVILSILKGRPLNTVYFAKNADGTFEVIDGQQRTLSILNFKAGNFSVEFNGDTLYYHNLTEDLRAKFDDYKLLAFLCEGTESEKLEWFQTINTAGEVLNAQELLNATYHGPFITSAREFFSKPTCRAVKVAQIDGKPLMKGSPIKQELLAKVLAWAGDAVELNII